MTLLAVVYSTYRASYGPIQKYFILLPLAGSY